MVDTLFQSGLGAVHISQIVSSLNDALVKRLVELAEAKLGAPPATYAWIVFGSEGRLEQTLLTDQDNALVYDDSTAAAERTLLHFRQAGRRRTDPSRLSALPGRVHGHQLVQAAERMAPTFHKWIRLPEPQALLDAAIFFDFRAVAGTLSLESLEEIIDRAQDRKAFLAHMLSERPGFSSAARFF